jgi:hypothetical protein
MRGEVQIWAGDELVLEEPNMLVCGAGELLADIMTVSRSLSGIEDTATSSILDSSNYTIQAISFGTGPDAYRNNAHILGEGEEDFLTGGILDNFNDGSAGVYASVTMDATSTAYAPYVGLPTAPNPIMTKLEYNTDLSTVIGGVAVSSVVPSIGQHTNFMPSAIFSSIFAGTAYDNSTSAYLAAKIMGAFPEGSGVYTTSAGVNIQRVNGGNEKRDGVYGGYFNAASSMDSSGFVTMIMSSVPNPGYSLSSTASGLTLSADDNFYVRGSVEYAVTLAAGDLRYVNAYGGIYHLGLWTIDMNQTLCDGNTPPFAFTQLNNPRRYRLFSRKGISKNLCHVSDNAEYQDLTIRWRLYFQ